MKTRYVKIVKGPCRGKIAIVLNRYFDSVRVRILDNVKVTKFNQDDYVSQIVDVELENTKPYEYFGPLFY